MAHQPVFQDQNPNSPAESYLIKKPEVSKAIYATLSGKPHYYRIESDIDFKFYAGITVPKIDNCNQFIKFSYSIYQIINNQEKLIAEMDGENFEWWEWYEPYGKKWYWIGPEYGAEFSSTTTFNAGNYLIKIYNKKNKGNYVLATGDIEKFGPLVIAKLPFVMPKVNTFWNQENCKK
jgi:hypothetical protein